MSTKIIWTDHARERLGQRGLSQDLVFETLKTPSKMLKGKKLKTFEFHKNFRTSNVTVIARKNETGEWVILSCWIDPPLPGTQDEKKKKRYLAFQNASFWGKVFLTIRDQLGL